MSVFAALFSSTFNATISPNVASVDDPRRGPILPPGMGVWLLEDGSGAWELEDGTGNWELE